MAWTVPSGCYYASSTEVPDYRYWSAGQSVPAQYVPNIDNRYGFILIDFTNGYIYGDTANVTINISANKTFTLTNKTSYHVTLPNVYLMASSDALSARTISLSGSEFAFGDGSGILSKGAFMSNGVDYSMNKAFKGRTDITNVTLPNGVGLFESCFEGCNSLQTVSGTISELKGAYRMFYGCTALTSAPTFQSVYTGTIYPTDTMYPNSFMYCFYNCASLVTTPTFPQTLNSNTDFRWCFYNCVSLTTPPVLAVGATKLDYAFYGCTLLVTAPTIPNGVTNITNCFYGCSSLTTVPTLPSTITNMQGAFYNCSSLTTAPTIPNGVTNIANCFNRCSSLTTVPILPSTITAMQGAFMYCTALTTAPTIPSAVTNMQQCFNGCTSLVTASAIPVSVTNTKWCFYNCAELTGAITIDASPTDITEMFTGTVKEIVLFGAGSINSIANNYNNVYVWSLSQTMTAVRSTPTTTVDISVDVSRYNAGNLVSLKLYKDNASTPLVVTWNDPTLTVTTNPTTFTTSVTGVADGDPTSFTVIATDIYGSANATIVNVPITFYTMDVQAGGKEIAFGTAADDDISNFNGKDYSTEGLFKCSMETAFNDMSAQEVEDFLDSLNVGTGGGLAVDLVIEQDTSGIWKYRKWSSGIVECWGTTGTTNYNMTTAYGGTYYGTARISIPSGLFISIDTLNVNRANGGQGTVWCSPYSAYSAIISNSYFDMYISNGTSYSNAPIAWSVSIKGRWK